MRQIADEELSDFVDGRIEEARRSEIDRAIAENPELAAKVKSYQRQAQAVHALYDKILHEPIPSRLLDIVRDDEADKDDGPSGKARSGSFFQWRAAAAILAVFVAGLGGGLLLHDHIFDKPNLFKAAVKQAVLSREMLEASETEQQEALNVSPETFAIAAKSNPFRVPLRAPSTVGEGKFVSVSFQSTAGAARPTVQLAYRSEEGDEITLFVQPHSASKSVPYETGVIDGYDVLYWIDGSLVYVLVGENGEEQLLNLADSFYSAPGLIPIAREEAVE